MNISIVGAAGEVGRALALHLLRGGLLGSSDRLQLVGHGHEAGERKLLAERADLLDAFDETAPRIEIAGEPEEVSGDVIAIAGGATLGGTIVDRRQLAEANRALFEAFGKAVADHGTGRELVIIVTNPVELGVEIVSRYIDPHRVLGMGAQQDERFGDELRAHQASIRELLLSDRVKGAFEAVEALPPDLRAAIEPFVTFYCLHSTPSATANATCDVIRAVQSGREAVVGAQVRLDGEFRGFRTAIGIPVLVDSSGWKAVVCPQLSDSEGDELDFVAASIEKNLGEWTSKPT